MENQLRGYHVVIGALQAVTEDICVECIMLEGVLTKVAKRLKRLSMDIEGSGLAPEERRKLTSGADALASNLGKIPQALEYT